jgi:hypothetical protein
VPTDDSVAVGTLSQDEEGRELFGKLGNSTAGSDTTGVSIEEIIFDCTDETLWLPSAPIGGDYRFRRVEAFIWTLRTSLAARLNSGGRPSQPVAAKISTLTVSNKWT